MEKENCVSIILSPNKLKVTRGDFSAIPVELKRLPNWVCWKKVTGDDGKITKVPINPKTLGYASTTNPQTWTDFETAFLVSRRNLGCVNGIGFVFTKMAGLIGIDLDKVRDPVTHQGHPSVNKFLSRFPSYTELSQSGTGYHIILKGQLPEGWGNKVIVDGMTVEIYDDKRYFVMTGDGERRSIEPITPEALEFLRPHLEGRSVSLTVNEAVDQTVITPEIKFGDDLIIQTFLDNAEDKVQKLFHGDMSAYGNDHSRADLALCRELAYCCDNESELDRLFRKSILYRPKWERDSYRIPTLRKAMESIGA